MASKKGIVPLGERVSSASDQAYGEIVDLILAGDLRPGERTSLGLLSERLKIGRAPIKEAITRLQADGILSVASRSGTTLNAMNAAETARLFELRRAVEGIAADAAVQNVTPALLSSLHRLLAEMSHSSDRRARGQDLVREAARFVKANVAFHKTLVSAAGSPLLDRFYAQLQLQVQMVTYLLHRGFDPDAAAQRQREHEGILAALEARDARLLKKRLETHATASEKVILRGLGITTTKRR